MKKLVAYHTVTLQVLQRVSSKYIAYLYIYDSIHRVSICSFQKYSILSFSHSIVCVESEKFGSPLENETYDGMIGQVQANETDTMFAFFPYDSVDHEPGIFLPAPIPAFSPHMYSAKVFGKSKAGLDVLYQMTNFTINEWLYWFCTLILCSILYVMSIHVSEISFEWKLNGEKIIPNFFDS